MPVEYYDYVYLFAEETIEGYKATLETILNLSSVELYDKGKKARNFILTKKNNVVQAGRIIDFMNSN